MTGKWHPKSPEEIRKMLDALPKCIYCSSGVAAGQTDKQNRPAHFSCQPIAERPQ